MNYPKYLEIYEQIDENLYSAKFKGKEYMCNIVNNDIRRKLEIIRSYEEKYKVKLPLIPIVNIIINNLCFLGKNANNR